MRKVWRCHVCGAYNSCVVNWCWICHELRDSTQKFISEYEQKNIAFIPGEGMYVEKEERGEIMATENKGEWTPAGTLRKSKAGTQLVLVVNKQIYTVNLQGTLDVIDGKRDYAGISKPPTDQPKA